MGCPITWSSKLQTEIALSTTATEYVALSQAIYEVLSSMQLVTELFEAGIVDARVDPKLYCKVFEDNKGALEMATMPKMWW